MPSNEWYDLVVIALLVRYHIVVSYIDVRKELMIWNPIKLSDIIIYLLCI